MQISFPIVNLVQGLVFPVLRIWHDSEEDARGFMESCVFSSVRLSATRSAAAPPRPACPDPLLRPREIYDWLLPGNCPASFDSVIQPLFH